VFSIVSKLMTKKNICRPASSISSHLSRDKCRISHDEYHRDQTLASLTSVNAWWAAGILVSRRQHASLQKKNPDHFMSLKSTALRKDNTDIHKTPLLETTRGLKHAARLLHVVTRGVERLRTRLIACIQPSSPPTAPWTRIYHPA
jgi:hypothetical protein